jgi:FKBP-type peptidyl-prolyl cis-trans isomerase
MVRAMKKSVRQLLNTAGALALLSAPIWTLAQTPAAPAGGAPPAAAAPEVPSTAEGSYLIGLSFGGQLHATGITNELNVEDIMRGVKDALAGRTPTPAEAQKLQAFGKSVIEGILARRKAEVDAFLTKNAQEKGVKTTASGLQYQVLIPGNLKAASPTATDTVTVQYRGKLLDGTEFDSSYARNEPATFPVNGVIQGWQELLPLMKPGAKYKVWIKPELGYGNQPKPGIPPGSLLIFEVELESIKPKESAAAAPAPKPAPTSAPSSAPAH